jgi:hypothetical protein
MKKAWIVGFSAAAGIALLMCESFEHRRSEPGSGGGGACTAPPGQFPQADCDPSDNSCSGGQCSISDPKCGSPQTCLPLKQNTGSVLDFRLRRLNVIAPPPLTYASNYLIQSLVIDNAVDLAAKECGENGKGTFNWLFRLDKGNSRVTTGGAPPVTDPFNTGYCFFNHKVGPLSVTQVTGPVHADPSGTYSTEPIPKLLVPIFLDVEATQTIVLPLTNTVIRDVTISSDGSCIGSLNLLALDNSCADSYSDCSKWHTAGSIGAFITLEDADSVVIDLLHETLCVLLTGSGAPGNNGVQVCARSGGKIAATGDYCSSPAGPGGCADSYWLAATFAASAVKINDGTNDPRCSGIPSASDAGADAPQDSPGDSPGDAPAPEDSAADAPSDSPADAPPE